MPRTKKAKAPNNEALKQKLWKTANKLRKNIDAAEYKHIVLGLIFLKYISDAFEQLHALLVAGEGEYEGADPEDLDEHKAENVFFVPAAARWPALQAQAKQPDIGQRLDRSRQLWPSPNSSQREKNRSPEASRPLGERFGERAKRNRKGEVLLIDASELGYMVNRRNSPNYSGGNLADSTACDRLSDIESLQQYGSLESPYLRPNPQSFGKP